MTSLVFLIALLGGAAPADDSSAEIRPADLLEGLDHPDRWRWIPDSRMPEGNLVKRLLVTSFVSPIFFFDSDVGAGGGFGITDIDFLNKRRSQFANTWITYTTEGQRRFSFSWRKWLAHRDFPGRGSLQGDRDYFGVSVDSTRTLTSRFFGLGADSLLDDESSYTRETQSISLGLQKSLPKTGGNWIWSANFSLQMDDISSGAVGEAFDTTVVYPELTSEADDFGALWIMASIRHDTRDAQHLPYEGHSVGLSLLGCPVIDQDSPAGELNGGIITNLTGTWVTPVPPLFHSGSDLAKENPLIDSVATFLSISGTRGEVPFWAYPALGGSQTLRGSIAGRWRDRNAWTAGVEWRPWIFTKEFPIYKQIRLERAGVAIFFDAGSVSNSFDQLFNEEVHYSYGIGLRFTFERQALFRADLGRSDEGEVNMSIRYGLPF
ncbi:MAG: hypothetical protein CBC13_04950 [Planctomycetia bacterium TMED53]|nr:MAG: hypothetical protein CBC13_04950 [Planctomycetia bacterium TMED53]